MLVIGNEITSTLIISNSATNIVNGVKYVTKADRSEYFLSYGLGFVDRKKFKEPNLKQMKRILLHKCGLVSIADIKEHLPKKVSDKFIEEIQRKYN